MAYEDKVLNPFVSQDEGETPPVEGETPPGEGVETAPPAEGEGEAPPEGEETPE